MRWEDAIRKVTPHVVRINTQTSYGTGFLAFYNHDSTWCGIATAAHVVSHADEWQLPIRIAHSPSEQPRLLRADQRVIMLDHATDSAVVLFLKEDLNLPEVPIPLLPSNLMCIAGNSIGWLGYPSIDPNTLCFFAGTISAQRVGQRAYFVDGVAINGVSGGPVIHCPDSETMHIVGCVSAYYANRATGEALPGLLSVQDVSHFHESAQTILTVDEANAKKREFEESREPLRDPATGLLDWDEMFQQSGATDENGSLKE